MDINLLPWRETRYKENKKRLHLECSIIFALLLLWVMSYQYYQFSVLRTQTAKIYVFEEQLKGLANQYQDAGHRQKLHQYNKANEQLLTMLTHIVSMLPNELYLTSIQKKENKIDLIGKSPSHTEIADFLQRIEVDTHQSTMVSETTHSNDGFSDIEFHISDEIN